MAITLGSNIASLRGQRQLSRTSEELGTVFQRLSSGQRINKASDDAAGLAIADSLKARSRIFNQGVRNLNDGLSLLNIADSAIENLSDIVVRLEELAAQAANGIYTHKQRKAMDDEAQALSTEFLRISKATEFNGQRLLTGEVPSVSLQAGVGANTVLSAGVGGAIGTGTFGSGTSFLAEASDSRSIKLGDLNADGVLDIVTVGQQASTGYATVRLGVGDGSFDTATSYFLASVPGFAAELSDLNGDGVLDLVAAGGHVLGGGGYAVTRLGRGDGTFGAAVTYATEPHASFAVAIDDLNYDGIPDLVTAGDRNSGGSGGGGGYATVRIGRGDGSFGASTSYAMEGVSSAALAVGDVNGDGILDILTAGSDGVGYATVRLGIGNGTFGSATSYAMEAGPTRTLMLGDINSDGALDIVTAGGTGSDGYATVRLGLGNGTFGASVSYATETMQSNAATLGDLNGDGRLDLATAGLADGANGYVTFRLGTGDGTFGAPISYGMESAESRAIALGDLNGDGVVDITTSGLSDGSAAGYVTMRLASIRDGINPILPFSLRTIADARQALPIFKRKREQLATQRGEIGAFQSRIDVARNVLEVSSENFIAAESRIRDADVAEESSRLVRLNILQKAASSVLAQANQQPALALQLLGA